MTVALARRAFPMAPDRGTAGGRAILDGTVQEITDVHDDPDYMAGVFYGIVKSRSVLGRADVAQW